MATRQISPGTMPASAHAPQVICRLAASAASCTACSQSHTGTHGEHVTLRSLLAHGRRGRGRRHGAISGHLGRVLQPRAEALRASVQLLPLRPKSPEHRMPTNATQAST